MIATSHLVNVTLTGGIALQTKDTWSTFIHKQDSGIIFGSNILKKMILMVLLKK